MRLSELRRPIAKLQASPTIEPDCGREKAVVQPRLGFYDHNRDINPRNQTALTLLGLLFGVLFDSVYPRSKS